MRNHFTKTGLLLWALLLLGWQDNASAQDYNGEIWGGYINRISLNDRWGIWNDYHYIPESFGLVRLGITYQTPAGYRFASGYAYVITAAPGTDKLVRQENRIWGQVVKSFKLRPKLQFIARFRYDARFRQSLDSRGDIIDGARTFNNRFRVMQNLRYRLTPLARQNFWHIDLINETLLNTGSSVRNGIDQVRSYVMLGYTQPSFTLLAGYHQRFIPGKAGNWTLNQGLTVWLSHNIDLGKEKTAD